GRANLVAAFPDKSSDEIDAIMRGVWENLGRFAAEFAQLDRIKTYDAVKGGDYDVEYPQDTHDRFHALRTGGKPTLIFAAHLGNWELPAQVAHSYGLD